MNDYVTAGSVGLKSKDEIEEWLLDKLGTVLDRNPEAIDVDEPFASYGLNSVDAVTLAAELEDWLGTELPASIAYQYPSIEALATRLATEAIRE